MEKDFFQSKTYLNSLRALERLEASMPELKSPSPRAQLEHHWRWGQRLAELQRQTPPKQKQKLLKALGKRFGKSLRLLFDLQQFYHVFPEGLSQIPHPERLSFSHIKAVLALPSEQERRFYLEAAAQDYAPVRRITAAVRQDFYALARQSSSAAHPQGELKRDLGPTYNYEARLIRVRDGDTLELIAEQGFYAQYRLAARLRGLNTSELHGPEAKRAAQAKRFVEQRLKSVEFFLIKTYKTDSFGRYIADVFYHPLWRDHGRIFTEGNFLNQELLDAGLGRMAGY